MAVISGLLYSQIGYDLGDPMRAIVRSSDPHHFAEGARFTVYDEVNQAVRQGLLTDWGDIWQSHWWIADFSGIQKPGKYMLTISVKGKAVMQSEVFDIGEHILWHQTLRPVAFDQMDARIALARFHKGWMDCGSVWREVNSHATFIIGLLELLEIGYGWLTDEDTNRLVQQLIHGLDYIASCQDRAEALGYGEGSIIHELPNHHLVIPGEVAQSVVAFAKAGRFIVDVAPEKAMEYTCRGEKAFRYLLSQARTFGSTNFLPSQHGAPEDYTPTGWMTRDLLMMMWGAFELVQAGLRQYKEDGVRFARQVMARQVPAEKAEDGLYGHFYTFDNSSFTEKAWIHHHVGHDTGGIFPHYVSTFIDLARNWNDHPDAALWMETTRRFALGYFLPACRKNPFYLLPQGYWAGEGLLWFAGPWHGTNAIYGFAAAMATQFESLFHEPEFRQVAVGNLQWIAGLNAGITRDSLKGCLLWKADIAEDKALPFSQIWGVGNQYAGSWTFIPGSITNGFCANDQFQFNLPPILENDAPQRFTDEDWIPHAAGWLAGIVRQRERRRYFGG